MKLYLVMYPDIDNHGVHRVDSIWFTEERAFERLGKFDFNEYGYVIEQKEGLVDKELINRNILSG